MAILAVAPLILFPFLAEESMSVVLLWLSFPVLSWVVLEPSVRSGETLRDARRRVAKAICTDPFFWVSLFLVLLTGVRALNGGVALVYDAESAAWSLAPSVLAFLPGCVKGAGFLPFAGCVSGMVLVLGCRHALGAAARIAFLLASSFLAGLAAVLVLFADSAGDAAVRAAIARSEEMSFFYGAGFFLHLMGGTAALVAAFERGWNRTIPLFALSIGGTAAAAFVFSPAILACAFLVAEVLLLAYVIVYSAAALETAGKFRLLVVSVLSFALGGLLVMALKPSAATVRATALVQLDFLPESFVTLRDILSGVAVRSWFGNLWLGTGVGSFPLAFRFFATPEDWQVVRVGAQTVPNGWLFLLAERGIVGVLIIGLPVYFLLFTYVRRLIGWVASGTYCHPSCWLGPLALVALSVAGVYGCAHLRTDVMIMAMALLAVSANAFPRTKRKDNG